MNLQVETQILSARGNFQTKATRRIVVRGANWIGDAVMTLPALRRLRRAFPESHLTLATPAWAEGIFTDAGFLDEILILNSNSNKMRDVWQGAYQWRAKGFDMAVIFPNSFGTALVPALARIPVRIGYATERRGALLTHGVRVPLWRGERHEVFYYLNIIAEIEKLSRRDDVFEESEARLCVSVSQARRENARAILRARGWGDARPLVLLCPGATNSRAKRWPIENFAQLADLLISQTNTQIALIGAPEEIDVSNAVAAQMHNLPLVLTGRTTLAETIAILSLADLLVTNDTGPAHLAATVNLPTLVIFGPTDPVTTRPFSPRAEVVRHPPRCAPCMLRDCPIDHRCMTAITPAEVAARACALLERVGHSETREAVR